VPSNFLVVTLDSCRWDVFTRANIDHLRALLDVEECGALATYTLPSHIAMLQGHFPHTSKDIPFFNRFKKSLFRIEVDGLGARPSLIQFPAGTRDIVTGLRLRGYRTLVVGAVGWFRSRLLTEPFESVHFSGIDIERQTEIVHDFVASHRSDPVFVLWNIGETHDPFEFGGRIREATTLRRLMRQGANYDPQRRDRLMRKQAAALEYSASFISSTISFFEQSGPDWTFVVCGDHGECFGEDNCYGHGFYHPLVMKVPFGLRLPTG